jgi:Zn-dependent M28 family amino/carboxypeptidase
MYNRKLFIAALQLLMFASCELNHHNDPDAGLSVFNAADIKAYIKVLASDSFMGRKPFTIGETRTVTYLQNQFKAIGLEPGNDTSYLQDVPMINIWSKPAANMHIQSAKGNFDLKGFDEYVFSTPKTDSVITLDKNQLVFAGYGVVAPEYNWNDYAGLDVKGKIVMVLVNDPGFNNHDTTLFKGKEMTYYGRWTYKFEEAARQGAKGCLVIHTTEAASYPFSVLQNGWNTTALRLDNGSDAGLLDAQGWITMDACKKVLLAAGQDTGIIAKADIRGFKGVTLNAYASTTIRTEVTRNKSHNVIGKITGIKYPDEYLVVTAHWDHLGVGKPDATGDSIYNGAIDNASGTASLLEFAKAFKSLQNPPERTVVFLAVTGEEQGLLGSDYYAKHPVYPLAKTIANLNVDEINWYGKTKDIIVVGKGQNELEDILKEEAEKRGRYIAYDNSPQAGHYYRSDHFSLAKVGVPALAQGMGVNVIGKDSAYGQQQQDEFDEKRYHNVQDNYNQNWDLSGAVDDLQLLFMVAKRLTYDHPWPQWKEGSEFKAERDKTAGERR